MMPSRLISLQLTFQGLERTGVPLVGYNGTHLVPGCIDDDIGLYVIVPRLAQWFHTSITQAAHYFLLAVLVGAALCASAAFCALYPAWPNRVLALLGTGLLTIINLRLDDIYLVPSACIIALVPWAYYLARKNTQSSWNSLLFVAGLVTGCAHYLRAHAGTAALLVVLALFLQNAHPRILRLVVALLCLCTGLALPISYFEHQKQRYYTFVETHMPEHVTVRVRHSFWHIAYMGLGFITNDLNLSYDDMVASQKALSVNPQAGSSTTDLHEAVLRAEVLHLLKTKTFYVVRVLVAKLSLIIFYLLLFGFLGILAFWRQRLPLSYLPSFAVGLLWSSLPGLLAIPSFYYLSGFISLAGVISIFGANTLLDKRTAVSPEEGIVSCRN